MGRVSEGLSYKVKNTFVEVGPVGQNERCLKLSDATDSALEASCLYQEEQREDPDPDDHRDEEEDADSEAAYSPGKLRLLSDSTMVPNTPSPFLHPTPLDESSVPCMNLGGFGGDMLPAAFGDNFSLGMSCGEGQDMGQGFFGMPVVFDPTTSSYTPCYYIPVEAPQQQQQQQQQKKSSSSADESGDTTAGEERKSDSEPMQSPGLGWCEPAVMHSPQTWALDSGLLMQDGMTWSADGMTMDQACILPEGMSWDPSGNMAWCMEGFDSAWYTGDGMQIGQDLDGQTWRKASRKERERERRAQQSMARKELKERERQQKMLLQQQHDQLQQEQELWEQQQSQQQPQQRQPQQQRTQKQALVASGRQPPPQQLDLHAAVGHLDMSEAAKEIIGVKPESSQTPSEKASTEASDAAAELKVEKSQEKSPEKLEKPSTPEPVVKSVKSEKSERSDDCPSAPPTPSAPMTLRQANKRSPSRDWADCFDEEEDDIETGSGSDTGCSAPELPTSGGTSSADARESTGKYTTVMLRNIPNKYTREMLVKQLNQDFQGAFDFVYLPIDFKNKCNVGYGFINFRTPTACDSFIRQYNGVDVRQCLPGLNSKKVAEVTPARVQGLEENVKRLRTSAVMSELVLHPDWMPLLLTPSGQEKPFPLADVANASQKSRRRPSALQERSGGREGGRRSSAGW